MPVCRAFATAAATLFCPTPFFATPSARLVHACLTAFTLRLRLAELSQSHATAAHARALYRHRLPVRQRKPPARYWLAAAEIVSHDKRR